VDNPILVDLGNVSGAVPIDLSRGNYFRFTATGNVIVSISGLLCRSRFVIDATQDGVGGRTLTCATQNVDPGGVFGFTATTAGARVLLNMGTDGDARSVTLSANGTSPA
jgi:hypothetical protein